MAADGEGHDAVCCDDAADPGDAAPLLATRRIVLGLAYDGAPFHGFAAQPGQRTVAGELAGALGRVFGAPPRIVCAGRTDAGVHARSQVVHADVATDSLARRYGELSSGETLPGLARSLSHQLGSSIAVFRAELSPGGFDARRSAIWRRYRYEIDCSGRPDPTRAGSTWSMEEPLELAAMRLAAGSLLGEHDFSAFCRRPLGTEGPIQRRVLEVGLTETEPGHVYLEIAAVAFCHQMVRSIVGMLVAIGHGRVWPSEVTSRLESGSRQGAPTIAPARGLCLIGVGYPEELGGVWQ